MRTYNSKNSAKVMDKSDNPHGAELDMTLMSHITEDVMILFCTIQILKKTSMAELNIVLLAILLWFKRL